jgi:hypothetical protein
VNGSINGKNFGELLDITHALVERMLAFGVSGWRVEFNLTEDVDGSAVDIKAASHRRTGADKIGVEGFLHD